MKAVLLLVAVQTALIAALFWKVATLESALVSDVPAAEAFAGDEHVEHGSHFYPGATPVALDEARVRAIFREELAVHFGRAPATTDDASPSHYIANETPAEYVERRDNVSDLIDYYRRVGSISEQDMSRLQIDIARLRESDREQLMMELVRAMNEGSIDGRL